MFWINKYIKVNFGNVFKLAHVIFISITLQHRTSMNFSDFVSRIIELKRKYLYFLNYASRHPYKLLQFLLFIFII